jgi:pyruvate carboxylase
MMKALVLGSLPTALKIAKQLEKSGISAVYLKPEHSLPLPSNQECISILKTIISNYDVDLVHPGTSIWGDRVELAAVVQQLGKTFVGPSVRLLNLFSNRLNFLVAAREHGLNTLLLSDEPLYSLAELERLIFKRKFKLPIVLKAVKSERSLGVFVLTDASMLRSEFASWLDQLRYLFGEVLFFVERHIEGARHIRIPFARDKSGRLRFFSHTDISLQMRGKVLVEVINGSVLDRDVEADLKKVSQQILDRFDFQGVGSLEFLVDGSRFFLVECEAKLNTGFYFFEDFNKDELVQYQLNALGILHKVITESVPETQCGIGLHLYAEDPVLKLPQPGLICEQGVSQDAYLPHLIGTDLSESEIHSDDGLLGSIFIKAGDYKEAIEKAHAVLNQVWIAGGVQTNERYLLDILKHPWVKEGIFHAGFVDEEFIPSFRIPNTWLEYVAQICKKELSKTDSNDERWVVADQWVKKLNQDVRWLAPPKIESVKDSKSITGRLLIDDAPVRIFIYPTQPDYWEVRLGPWFFSIRRVHQKDRKNVAVSLLNGVVHSILFQKDSLVPAHEPFIVVRSLKQLVAHAFPIDAVIETIQVAPGNHVRKGQELARFQLSAKN